MTGRTCHIGFPPRDIAAGEPVGQIAPTAVHSVVQRPWVGAGRRVAE